MKETSRFTVALTTISAAFAVFSNSVEAQVTFQSVTNGLVSFYPLDHLTYGTLTTPDIIGGRDLFLSPATTAANIVPANRPIGAPGASSNCFNLNQVGGATVLYYNTKGQNPLDIKNPLVSDFLPFCNQLNATMSFWIKSAATGTDLRFMGEAANDGNNDPLWLWGDHSSKDGAAHLFMRLRSATNYYSMSDGTSQSPVIGTFTDVGYMTQDTAMTTNTLMDGTWHLFTVVIDNQGFVDVYIDGTRDPGIQNGASNYVNALGQPSVCKPMFVTNTYYTTNVYPLSTPPAMNPPPNGYVKWVLNSTFKYGSTAFGGFKRGTISAGKVMQIDDIAFWNRALSAAEVNFVYTNGLPGIAPSRPPVIGSFAASLAEVGKGDLATLSWEVFEGSTNPGSILISGVGDVSSIGTSGSIDVPVNSDQSFTLTATMGGHSTNKPINVKVLPGVDSNWHLYQRFDGLFTNTIAGIDLDIFGNGDWYTDRSSFYGWQYDRWNVVTLTAGGGTNKVLSPRTGYSVDTNSAIGFASRGALAYGHLNSLTIGPDQNRTLFFRFSLRDPQSWAQAYGVYSDMDASIGISDYNWYVGPEGAGAPSVSLLTKGPFVRFVRTTSGGYAQPEPFDLRAYDYNGTSTASIYSYRASVNAAGLETNVNYMLWMDIQNRNTGYDTNTSMTTNMPLYSVYLQKQGDATRTLLFSGFRGNRDFAPSTDPFGPNQATPFLNKFFANMGPQSFLNGVPGAYFETNMIAIDDIYISKNGFESSIPKLFDVTSIVRNPDSVTIAWNSLGSLFQTNTYTVLRNTQTSETWTPIGTVASGGDTTTFTDDSPPTGDAVYYRISWP